MDVRVNEIVDALMVVAKAIDRVADAIGESEARAQAAKWANGPEARKATSERAIRQILSSARSKGTR